MKHIVVASNRNEREPGYKYAIMVSPTALSEARIGRLNEEAQVRPVEYLWLPGAPSRSMFQAMNTVGLETFLRGAPLNYEPPTDDKPYLNNFAKTRRELLQAFRPQLWFSGVTFAALLGAFVTGGGRRGAGRPATLTPRVKRILPA